MLDEKTAIGFAAGVFTGALTMGVFLAKPVRDIMKQDKAYKARQKAMFEHMIETMGPHCPVEVLKANLEYLEFDSIVTHEEGKQ